MAKGKTIDGLKVSKLVRTLEKIPDVEVREGRKHPFIAYSSLADKCCPIAESTHVNYMVVPWLAGVTGYEKSFLYDSLRKGTTIG